MKIFNANGLRYGMGRAASQTNMPFPPPPRVGTCFPCNDPEGYLKLLDTD